jgi:succinylglutamate desuccinylase
MKRVTILAAMHGDETYGIVLYNAFVMTFPELADNVQLIIGNEQAFKDKARYIDADMNREYESKDKNHESQEIQRVERQLASFSPHFILDIHTTRRDSGVFFISDTPNPTRQTLFNMLEIDVCIMRDEVIKKSFIGHHPNAVSLEYSLKSISDQTTKMFVENLAKLINNTGPKKTTSRVFTVSKLISKEEWLRYKSLQNYDSKREGTALMVPADTSEMDAEYYGFWCHEVFKRS